MGQLLRLPFGCYRTEFVQHRRPCSTLEHSGTDRIEKNEEYRATASIQRYVMLEQTRQAATVFSRMGDDWVGHVLIGDVSLAMPEIQVDLPLSAFYSGIEFADARLD